MKKIKVMLGIIIVVLLIIIAGAYKFNYLANKDGYDVDGNKITKIETPTYLESRIVELEKDGIKIIYSDDNLGNNAKETFYFRDSDENPLREVSLSARALWYSEFIGMDKNDLLKKYKSFKESDFKNTGDLKEQFDFDILLNNFLKRIGLEPHNSEHIESLIDDLNKDIFISELKKKEMMTIKVPNLEWDDEIGDFVIRHKEYIINKTPRILNAVYKKLFELNLYDGKYEGLIFDSVSIDKNKIARVMLSGNWFPTGCMSQLFFRENIDGAAFQFDSVDIVEVYVNGKLFDWCIDDESDGEGACDESAQYWVDKK